MNEELNTIQNLIRQKTVESNKAAFEQAWQIIDAKLANFSYKRYVSNGYESRLYYASSQMPAKFDVILNFHLDVVEGSETLFIPRVVGDRLYGRGAYDMKAAGVIEMFVFDQLARKLPINLGLQIVTDEEKGGHNGTKYQFENGLTANFGLVGESGSNLTIKTQAKGITWFKVTFIGKSSHAAKPWQGENSLYQANQFLTTLAKRYPIPTSEVWQTTVTPTQITTHNQTLNQVPDLTTVMLDVRFIPEDANLFESNINRMLPPSAKLEILLADCAHNTTNTHPLVTQLLDTCRQNQLPTKLDKSHGTGDIRFFTRNGSAGVEFGPVGDNAHGEDEWISIKSLKKFKTVLTSWLSQI